MTLLTDARPTGGLSLKYLLFAEKQLHLSRFIDKKKERTTETLFNKLDEDTFMLLRNLEMSL